MTTQIPFVDELRRELLDHAPASLEPEAPVRWFRRFSGPAVALAVFLLVVVGGGMAIWLTVASDTESADPNLADWDVQIWLRPPDDPQELIAEVQTMPEVVETRYVPDVGVLFPEASDRDSVTEETTSTATPSNESMAALLIRIADGADPDAVAIRLSQRDGVFRIDYSPSVEARVERVLYDKAESGATVIREEPLIIQPQPAPEPTFDTSQLGQEVVVEPVSPDESMMEQIQRDGGLFAYRTAVDGDDALLLDTSRPIVNIGRVTRSRNSVYSAFMQLIIYPTADGGYCEVTLQGGGWGSSCEVFTQRYFGVIGGGTGPGPYDHMEVAVPIDTAVVAVDTPADGKMWQRPTLGWALFLTESRDLDFAGTVVDAYDQSGNLIGHWETP